MTSKERAAKRAEANSLDVLFQVGKGGISDALIEQTDGALRTRELIKLRVLTETSPTTPRETADSLAAATNAEVIQVIGGVIVLYRLNPDLHKKPEKAKSVKKNGKYLGKRDVAKPAAKRKFAFKHKTNER